MSVSEIQAGYELAKAYEKGELCGWGEVRQPGIAKEQFDLLSAEGAFVPFGIAGKSRVTAGKKVFLHHVTRKVLGTDTKNYPQEVGDCVAMGMKNAVEYLQCAEKLMLGEREKWRPVFAPFYYGTGRVYVGKGRLGNSDGSLGSWMAQAVMKYGTLFSDEPNVPAYSGSVAKRWGDPSPGNDLDLFKGVAAAYVVRSAAMVRTWDEFVAAIANGYPCTTASNLGYDMTPSSDGFHRQRGSWAHQMCFIGVDDNDTDPYALLLNTWGDVHGRLKDFGSDETLPVGVLRIRRKDVEKHLRAGETFACSNFAGFPEQKLDEKLFMLV